MSIKFNDLQAQWNCIANMVHTRMARLFRSSQYILGDDVKTFENNWAKYIGCNYAISVNSGTDAITLSIEALVDPKKNTLIITQDNTYIATIFGIINGLYNDNYTLHIIDCDKYGQINIDRLIDCLKKHRHAYDDCIVVPVHMYGACCDAETLIYLQDRYDFKILEDSAQAHGTITNFNDRKTGNIGNVAAFSFYPGKNLGACGDAGIITTNDSELYEQISRIGNMGSKFKHVHSIPGRNSRLDTMQAIILDEKLKLLDLWNWNRQNHAAYYDSLLQYGIDNLCPDYCKYHTYHLYHYPTQNPEDYFKTVNGIQFGQHYKYTVKHTIGQYRHIRYKNISCDETPNAKALTQRITLPMHPFLADAEIEHVCETVL